MIKGHNSIKGSLSFDWPYAHGGPSVSFDFKKIPEDFVVEELINFDFTGQGEHLCLWLEKKNVNTQFIAERLAQFLKTRLVNVGFSGLKDRHALTRQWFSIPVGLNDQFAQEAFCQTINQHSPDEQITILKTQRHQKKLKRGVHRANRFQIRLRNVEGNREKLEAQLICLKQRGFPNYFGDQRFGRDNQNVVRALDWLLPDGESQKKNQKIRPTVRSLYLSSIRSYLFNHVLARRVAAGTWQTILPGETVMLNGTHSVFVANENEQESLKERAQRKDIHPTGPLFGADALHLDNEAGRDEVFLLEHSIFDTFVECFQHSALAKLKSARRSLRAIPEEFGWHWDGDNDLLMEFILPSGAFATSLVREIGCQR